MNIIINNKTYNIKYCNMPYNVDYTFRTAQNCSKFYKSHENKKELCNI